MTATQSSARIPWRTRLYYSLGQKLPFLKIRPPDVDREAVMTLRPVRNSQLTWEKQDGGEVLLTVPQRQDVGWLTRTLARWLKAPLERHVELDAVGGFVWELCDGTLTVESVVQKAARQFKMNRREAEVSVTTFLQMLHERNFVGFYRKVKKQR